MAIPCRRPGVLLSGGETTVTVKGKGRGGRNVEFLLALAVADKAAGAIVTPDTLARATVLGIEPTASLAANDGHGFFEALGDQLVTATLTNVNDFRAILILPNAA